MKLALELGQSLPHRSNSLEVSSGLGTGCVDLVSGDLERGQALVIVKGN